MYGFPKGPAFRLGRALKSVPLALPALIPWRDGVFDATPTGGVIFHAATGISADVIAQVQAQVRQRLSRVFVRRGRLPGDDAQAMAQWKHVGGFWCTAS